MNNFTPNQLLTQLILFFVLRNLKMNFRCLEFFTNIYISIIQHDINFKIFSLGFCSVYRYFKFNFNLFMNF